ncbi:MAG: DUF6318 family protein [Actinomycetota bacterium]
MSRFWVIGVVLALAVAGCSSGAADEPSSTTSRPVATARPTATAAETVPAPPGMPAEAREATAAGAAAFVRHWFDVANHAYATGDTLALQAISSPDCQTCTNTIETIDDQYASGGSFKDGQITVELAEAAPPDATGTSIVSTRIDQQPLQRIGADEAPGERSDGEEDLTLAARAQHDGERWIMLAIAPGDA